jgi:uncharacterized protein (DUF2236 family)
MQRPPPPADTSVARRLNGERLVLFGWSRAILMQLAHPLVAAGVAEHSTFRQGRFAAALRLHHTVRAMLALTFGTEAGREQALDGIRAIHRRVNGHLSATVGRYPAGTRYSAEDPELVLWVHATLMDSIPLVYQQLVAPLTRAERDRYCEEAAPVAIALGADPATIPRDQAAVTRYIETMVASGAIVVGGDARTLADAVMQPPLQALTRPAAALNRLMTIGWLPVELRRQYGFGWTEDDARRRDRAARWLRQARQVTPARLALWRDAR